MQKNRIIGLDYGSKTVGVAISDPFGIFAQSLETIRKKDDKEFKPVLNRLNELVEEYNVSAFVLGYPKNMNNTEGIRCKLTLVFKEKLENRFPGLAIHLEDERMTSISAQRLLIEADVRRDKRKKLIDKTAAAIILQSYLDRVAISKNTEEV